MEGTTRIAETKYAKINELPICAAAKPGIIKRPPLIVEPVAIAYTSNRLSSFFNLLVFIEFPRLYKSSFKFFLEFYL